MYKAPDKSVWKGRKDSESQGFLCHHIVQTLDLQRSENDKPGFVLLGFESDEGVKRNLGRAGAKDGPDSIRAAMSNLVVHKEINLYDGGNVSLKGEDLESGQAELARYVKNLLEKSHFPILLGGGHEISYGHVKGALDHIDSKKKLGVINFDPHFDLRGYPDGPHSGSWAKQLFDEFENVSYFPIGINEAVNLPSMYELMRSKDQGFITMDELLSESTEDLKAKVEWFMDGEDHLCLTLDLDVFSAGIAPGVSAANAYGAGGEHIKPLISAIAKSDKLLSFDVAEMNPVYDDGRTAKLAALFIHQVIHEL